MNYYKLEKVDITGNKDYVIVIGLSTEKNKLSGDFNLISAFFVDFPKYTIRLNPNGALTVWYSIDAATIKTGKWRVPDLDELEKTIKSKPDKWEEGDFTEEVEECDCECHCSECHCNEEEDYDEEPWDLNGVNYYYVFESDDPDADQKVVLELSSKKDILDDNSYRYGKLSEKFMKQFPQYRLYELMENIFEIHYTDEAIKWESRLIDVDQFTDVPADEIRQAVQANPEWEEGEWNSENSD